MLRGFRHSRQSQDLANTLPEAPGTILTGWSHPRGKIPLEPVEGQDAAGVFDKSSERIATHALTQQISRRGLSSRCRKQRSQRKQRKGFRGFASTPPAEPGPALM
jgi:hypothetical protein